MTELQQQQQQQKKEKNRKEQKYLLWMVHLPWIFLFPLTIHYDPSSAEGNPDISLLST